MSSMTPRSIVGLYPISEHGKFSTLNFEDGEQMSGHRPSVLYTFSLPVTHSRERATAVVADPVVLEARRALVASARERTVALYHEVASSSSCASALVAAASSWGEAVKELRPLVSACVDVFADVVFPFNKYTRRRADLRGSQLYLPGLIKAVMSNFSYKRVFSTKSAGGRREYCVTLIMDVSPSMAGYLEDCTVMSFVVMVSALLEIGVDSVTVLLFDSGVKIIKVESQEWDAVAMLALLSNLSFDTNSVAVSNDGHALHCALDLIEESPSRGPKHVFVFTDGYTSNELELRSAQDRADELGVEVVGICVGMEPSLVARSYRRWMKVALPSAIPDAFRAYYEQEASGVTSVSAGVLDSGIDDWIKPEESGAAKTTDEVFRSWTPMFPELHGLLQGERELKLSAGSSTGRLTLDICFVIDCTGSMRQYLGSVKVALMTMCTQLDTVMKERQKDDDAPTSHLIRFSFIGYRDIDDGKGHFDECRFQPVTGRLRTQEDVVADNEARAATVCKELERLVAKGGGDECEDVIGALERVCSGTPSSPNYWGWSTRACAKFCILVCDSPCHGSSCHPSDRPSTEPPLDNYPHGVLNGRPCGPDGDGGRKGIQSLMRQLHENKINLVVCHLRPASTSRMFEEFERAHKLAVEKTPGPSCGIFSEDLSTGAPPFSHIVFVLDASSSMAGDPFCELRAAFAEFIETRLGVRGSGQGMLAAEKDVVTVLKFGATVETLYRQEPLRSARVDLGDREGSGRGMWDSTDFKNALQQAHYQMAACSPGATPMLVFMSDGDGIGGEDEVNALASTFGASGLQMHFVAFGTRPKAKEKLKALASLAGNAGKFHEARSGEDLIKSFKSISIESPLQRELAELFRSSLADLLVDRLLLEYM